MNKIIYQDSLITRIELESKTHGTKICIIDTKNWDRVKVFNWWVFSARKDLNVYYGQAALGKHKIYMHRLITSFNFKVVDHIDLDGLNNLEKNLRSCHQNRNICNRKKYSKLEKFKGIMTTPSGSFHGRITVNTKSIYLGSFSTAEEAARAYDKSALFHFKENALTNFPREEYL